MPRCNQPSFSSGNIAQGVALSETMAVGHFALGTKKIPLKADSTLKCNLFSSKKKREAGDAKPKHFLGLVLIFWRQSARYAAV